MFDSMKNIAKLWIHDEIGLHFNVSQPFLSSMIPKIEKCNLRSLNIFRQRLTFDEYLFLTSSGDLKHLELSFCTISHSDGTLVTFDQLFINCPELECFTV
uniref:Uncharacterized protein n=1 Tax=Panagrolaimus superbus TaxID=310955 RepID=A0A914YMK8_9BILA